MDWGLAKVLAEGGVADEERASRPPPVEGTQIRTARSSGSGVGTDTEAGSLLGTPAYMPPEQANGEVAYLDRRADVFGLGAILCEILTGKPPYVGRSSEEVRRKACNGDLADATARLDACGADMELIALTRTCLAAEAIDRPKDAQAVADGLTAYLNGVQERLHQAELAEAEARAKAVEEAKRRRLTLALAATVLLALTLGGGGYLYVKNERDARQAQVAREVDDAVNKATALREKAKVAPVGGAALFGQAREQTQRALALVETGPADELLQEQVRKLQAELDEEVKDRRLLAALDEAHLAQAETLSENRFASERAVPLFRAALRAYGLPAGEGEPAAVAERIRQRPPLVREGLLAALDEWLDLAVDPQFALTEPHRDWLRAVLVAAEPQDAWTPRFRAASRAKDVAQRRAALEKLATEADVVMVPARALTRLAARLESVEAQASAVRLLRRAQQQYPADFWVNHELGSALTKVTPPQWDETVRFFTAAVALRPESPGACLNLGLALKRKGRLDEAIAYGRKAIDLDPKYASAHTNLGTALRAKGQVDEAIACYHQAIALDPKNARTHTTLGNALRVKGQVDEAIACYHQALALDPKYAQAHNNLGNALRVKGQVDEAIACYRKAIELDPKLAQVHFNLGNALRGKGQLDEAIACLQKAIALDPNYAWAHSNLGNALADKGQVDEAIACCRKAIEIDPNYANAHSNLGGVLADKGQLDEAIACFQKAIALDPKVARAHSNLGNALHGKGEVDEAIACLQKAIALDPKYANAHSNLGHALADKGQVDEAMACWRKAIALDPKYAKAHFGLGRALKNKGQVDEAIACYRRAIAFDPKFALARTELAKAERLAAARDKLPAFWDGSYTPASTDERLGLAAWCKIKKLHRTATGLYAAAFAADPKLADDLKAGHRYNAACYAALAAAGQGEDAAKLRQQAFDWLRADLALRRKQLESGQPTDRAAVQRALRHWQKNTDLAGLRDAATLAKLPAEERAACERLWSDVAALLQRDETPAKKDTKP
jgi:tetratricopeptide (TPR) repeat protein